jgi:hypothetical protein
MNGSRTDFSHVHGTPPTTNAVHALLFCAFSHGFGATQYPNVLCCHMHADWLAVEFAAITSQLVSPRTLHCAS